MSKVFRAYEGSYIKIDPEDLDGVKAILSDHNIEHSTHEDFCNLVATEQFLSITKWQLPISTSSLTEDEIDDKLKECITKHRDSVDKLSNTIREKIVDQPILSDNVNDLALDMLIELEY